MGARRPYPEMRQEEMSNPEGTQEYRQLEYMVNYSRAVCEGAELVQRTDDKFSRGGHGLDVIIEDNSDDFFFFFSPENASREPMNCRRTIGRTRYRPGYYARLHKDPHKYI